MGNNPSVFQGQPDHPVEKVSWIDCQQFMERLNQSLRSARAAPIAYGGGMGDACRAGTTTKYYFGDDPTLLSQYCWFRENAHGTTHPVGQLKPNAWGLYDMYGNVYDWCSDWYMPDYYRNLPAEDPQGPPSGAKRILRGGAFSNQLEPCCSASRNMIAPELANSPYGVRVVCEPKAETPAGVSNDRSLGGARNQPRSSACGDQRPMAFDQAEIERNVAT